MPWQFNAQQLRRIQGSTRHMPDEEVAALLNGCSNQLQAFFNEKRATTVLVGSGNQLRARLDALENLVVAMSNVNVAAHRFSASNVSSMLDRAGTRFVSNVEEIIT